MTTNSHIVKRLTGFYSDITSLDAIVRALSREGIEAAKLTAKDLYTRGLDCQNLGGFAQLEAMANAVNEFGSLEAPQRVLDVGSGLGGPSRYLADRFGIHATGIDLLQVRVDTARVLSQMVGMSDRTEYHQGDASNLALDAETFDQAWALDMSIHVRDKAGLFRSIHRSLRPGGLLVLHDQTGPLPKTMAPVTRRAPYIAVTLPQLLRYVEEPGFRVLAWTDTTERVLKHLRSRTDPSTHPDETVSAVDARKQQRRAASRDAYIQTLESPMGRTGFLIARKVA